MQGSLTEAHPSSRPYLPGSILCPRLFDSDQSLVGVGGRVSLQAEDFMVHEIPKYFPSGEGEHCMVHILKSNRTTDEAVKAIAEGTGVLDKDIAYAGRKDKYALTTQWLSVPCPVEQLKSSDDQVMLLSAYPHRQKMRLGHNLGNLFSILISDIPQESSISLEIERIKKGLPNYFAEQRFGRAWYEKRPTEGYQPPQAHDGIILQDPENRARDNVDRAFMFLERFVDTKRRPNSKQKRDVKLALSALQSALFNLWIGERIQDDLINQVIEGDVCRKQEGGTFYSTDPELDTQRLLAGEIMVLGPMLGPKLFPAQGRAKAREEALYQKWGLNESMRSALGKFWRGDRRPLLLKPRALNHTLEKGVEDQVNLRVSFILPSGSFATAIMAALIDPSTERFERI